MHCLGLVACVTYAHCVLRACLCTYSAWLSQPCIATSSLCTSCVLVPQERLPEVQLHTKCKWGKVTTTCYTSIEHMVAAGLPPCDKA